LPDEMVVYVMVLVVHSSVLLCVSTGLVDMLPMVMYEMMVL